MNFWRMIRMGMLCWIAILLNLYVAQLAFAQAPVQMGSETVHGELVRKQALVRGLIEEASGARRIMARQDAEAIDLFPMAKDNYTRSLTALKNEDFSGAAQQLNEVISRWILLLSLRIQSPDSIALAIKKKTGNEKLLESYEGLLGSVEYLEKAYRSYMKQAGLQFNGVPPGDGADPARIAGGVEEAMMYAKSDRMGDAMQALGETAQAIISAMNHVLSSATVDYTMKFETYAEEYAYEVERNRIFCDLIPVAIAEINLTDEEKLTIGELVEQNRIAIRQAHEHAMQQDFHQALTSVYAGTGFLERALSVAGLVAPPAYDSQP